MPEKNQNYKGPPSWCDYCIDQTKIMKPLKLKFPNGQEKEVNLCHECDRKREKIKKKMEADPRKQLAAKLLAALQGKPEEKRDYLFKKSR